MIHIITGLPSSGKTTVAKYLERKLSGLRINTDEVHQLLFPSGERNKTGGFTPNQLQEIYRSLAPISYYLNKLDSNKNIILEGSFRSNHQREFLADLFIRKNIPFNIVFVELSDNKKTKRRISQRLKTTPNSNPDTYEDYLEVKNTFERPEEAHIIDNSGSIKNLYKQIDQYLDSI